MRVCALRRNKQAATIFLNFGRNALANQTSRLYPRQKRSSNPSRNMARTPQDITDAELSVLQILWDKGRETIRELTDVLYPSGTGVHYATVQKLLERLEGKKFVKRDRT